MDSLADRLKALGLIQASKLDAKKPAPSKKFAEVIEGTELSNSLGACYLVENAYPWNYQHGLVTFDRSIGVSTIADAGKVSNMKGEDISKLLFLDTETTGLSGGTGTLAFLIGLGYFSDEGFILKQFISRDPTEESAMLLEIANLVNNFTGIVTFNGKSFDIPLLNTRYIINRLQRPFDSLAHLDLLYLSRKLWKNRLQSRALQDLEQEILQIPRKQDEVPGWMIPQIYFDYLRSGDPEPLKGVIYHNGMDIVSLAALFIYVSQSFETITTVDRFHPVDYFSMGQVFYEMGFFEVAEKIFLECTQNNKLSGDLRFSLYHRLGDIYKRRSSYDQAVLIWQMAAQEDDIESVVELAKYYEHTSRDYEIALEWTEIAVSSLDKKGYHTYQSRQFKKELLKRKNRLSQKSERKNGHVSEKNP